MLKIKKYDEIIEKQDKEELKKVNVAVFRAYNALKETKNSMLDFAETYYMEGIKGITEELKKFGIENFTVSEASTALMSELEEFEKFGFKVQGLTQVVSQMRDYQTFEVKYSRLRSGSFLLQRELRNNSNELSCLTFSPQA